MKDKNKWRDPVTDPPKLGKVVLLQIDNAYLLKGFRRERATYFRYFPKNKSKSKYFGKITGWETYRKIADIAADKAFNN